MNILTICGVFAPENEQEILRHAKKPVEYSANVFQEKLIRGIRETGYTSSVISAPFIGSYPNASDWVCFKGFETHQNGYEYVPFLNLWGLRNYSRCASLKKTVADFIQVDDSEKLIIVYSPHTPFLEAAVYAKSKDPRIKICLVIPDVPQYMNLNAHVSMIYKIGKKFDIAKFNKLNRHVDSYMLLTKAMRDVIDTHGCPYCVIEGIVNSDVFDKKHPQKQMPENDDVKYIVYTGKTNEKFGVKELVDAFETLVNPNLRLVICGSGDSDTYIAQKAKMDSRLLALGQVPHDQAIEWVCRADVLVNPRQDNEEYTKYSFPSKNIEYLSSGNPTVGYILRGMKPIYRDFMFAANEDGLGAAITRALNVSEEEMESRRLKMQEHFQSLMAKSVAEQIIERTFSI